MPRGCGPLNPRSNVLGHSDVLCATLLAMVRVTRLSRLRRSAYPLASACCGAMEDRNSFATTRLPTTNQAGYSISVTISPQLEQYNRVRGSSALVHATDGPKSRKLHYGEYVGPTHVSPPNPRIKARFQRAALEPFGVSFSSIFLHEKKDGAVGDRRLSREVGKTGKPPKKQQKRAHLLRPNPAQYRVLRRKPGFVY